nr:hypothetical protein [Lachnospiraceae bacterium]
DDYDWTYTDLGEGKHMWTGHTWKSYTFEFNHEQWTETPAREVTRQEVEAIAALPASFDETDYDSVQYILRENGELNINMAKTNPDYPSSINFNYITFHLSETQEWIADNSVDGNGTYAIQMSGEKHWDYMDHLLGYE